MPVKDHRNTLESFVCSPFLNDLFWVGILISHHLKVGGLPGAGSTCGDGALYPLLTLLLPCTLPTASLSRQGSGRTWGYAICCCGALPQADHSDPPIQVSQRQHRGCFYGLLFPVPLRLVIFFSFFWAMDEKSLFPLLILVRVAEREIKGEEWMISYLDMRTEN